MPKLKPAEEFDVAVKAVAKDAIDGATSRELAEQFYAEQPDLVNQFDREWKLEKLTFLIAKERAAIRRARDPQRLLGFKLYRRKIVLDSGREFREGDATLKALRLWRKQLGKEKHPLLPEIEKRIEFMEPWSKKKRGITFTEATEQEAKQRGLLEELP